jgi:hypothetical protein
MCSTWENETDADANPFGHSATYYWNLRVSLSGAVPADCDPPMGSLETIRRLYDSEIKCGLENQGGMPACWSGSGQQQRPPQPAVLHMGRDRTHAGSMLKRAGCTPGHRRGTSSDPASVPDHSWRHRLGCHPVRAYSGMAMADHPKPPKQPIGVNTAREMIQARQRVSVWCPTCKVWREVNLAEMVMRGRGDECLIGRRWRCRDCGSLGTMQLESIVRPGYVPHNKPGGAV